MISSVELAKICGVSQATVDRAIHDRPGIAQRTRQKVLREAAKHGYRANPVAGELLRGDSRIIGAVVPMFGRVFFADLMSAIARELAGRGQRLFLTPAENEAEFYEAIGEFAARRVRAIVVIAPREGLTLDRGVTGDVPVVAVINDCGDAPFVSADEEATGRAATAYLADRGHRRIVHATYQRQGHALRLREAGYVREMRRRGLEPVVVREVEEKAFKQAVFGVRGDGRRADRKKTGGVGVFCHNDWMAARVMGLLGAMGLAVPGDVSVLGVDDTPTLRQVWPTLSTMGYPMLSVAKRVAAIVNGQAEKDWPMVEAMRIIERGSLADYSL